MKKEQKIAVVTGAGSPKGIGSEIARTLAKAGNHVFICDVDITNAELVAEQINNNGFVASAIKLDVTSEEEVRSVIQRIVSEYQKIDILVNNAGVSRPSRVLDITEKEFDFIFDVNVKGTYFMTQAVLPTMIDQQYGRIVNLGSVSAKRGGGVFGGSHYSAAKAAVMGFTKAVAREMAPHGITVNSVAPGLIGTGITGDLLNDKEVVDTLLAGIPAGRIGTVEDVAEAILFLSSEKSGYITGEEIDINGGSHMD